MNKQPNEWTARQLGSFSHAFVQFQAQQLAASVCDLEYEVRLSNDEALKGFSEKIPLVYGQYRNVADKEE